MKHPTHYELLEASPQHRRRLRQEELILDVTETLTEALNREEISRSDLAVRLNRSKAFVSQLFGGSRNLTLRTIADVADSLGYTARIVLQKQVDNIVKLPSWRVEPIGDLRQDLRVVDSESLTPCNANEIPGIAA